MNNLKDYQQQLREGLEQAADRQRQERSPVAQSVARTAVNREVAGSNPAGGA